MRGQLQCLPSPFMWLGVAGEPPEPVNVGAGLTDYWLEGLGSQGATPTEIVDWGDKASGGNYDLLNLTSGGSPVVQTGANSRWGEALSFNGTNQYLRRADETLLRWTHPAPITWAVWVQLGSITGLRTLFGKSDATRTEYELRWQQTSGILGRFVFYIESDTHNFTGQTNVFAPSTTAWYLVTCGYNPGANQAFCKVNLTLSTSGGTNASGATSKGAAFNCGRRENGIQYLAGKLEQLARWNRLLAESEVAWIFERGMADVYPATWQFQKHRPGAGLPAGWPSAATAPAAPSDVYWNMTGSDSAEVIWVDNAVRNAAVVIERATDGGAWAAWQTLAARTTLVTDSISPAEWGNSQRAYRVKVVDEFGQSSAWAEGYSAPIAPTIGIFLQYTGTQATILNEHPAYSMGGWVDTFELEYSLDGGSWVAGATFDLGTSEPIFTVTGAVPTTMVRVRVRAVKSGQASAWIEEGPIEWVEI